MAVFAPWSFAPLLMLIFGISAAVNITLEIIRDDEKLKLELHERKYLAAKLKNEHSMMITVQFPNDTFLSAKPECIFFPPNEKVKRNFSVRAEDITYDSDWTTEENWKCFADGSSDCAVKFVGAVPVTIYRSDPLLIISQVIGWIYFVAWSISFYPQIWLNFSRKSVRGLSFDFLSLNILGFFCYSVYNCAMSWNDVVREQYEQKYRHAAIPVAINDVVFGLHALAACLITAVQCFIYERGSQKVAIWCWIFIGCSVLLGGGLFPILVYYDEFTWLTAVSSISYIKLAITLIKYVPQAWMNFRRKSTVGWSIGNVLLDFTGGTLSILQMVVDSYNTISRIHVLLPICQLAGSWSEFFGDPTKFGLGLFSVCFDVLFIVQHYILYRNKTDDDIMEADYDNPAANVHIENEGIVSNEIPPPDYSSID